MSGQGKFEQLEVASKEIAASSAQLVVASRVKADRNSKNMSALSQASKRVAQATAGVVATSKSCGQMIEENGKFLVYFRILLACLRKQDSHSS